jgi:uncharacterized delta-60 repeat protein
MARGKVCNLRTAVLASITALLLMAVTGQATPGQLDSSFSSDGITTHNIAMPASGKKEIGRSIVIQADGKIVVVGQASNGGAFNDDFAIWRYNTDGTLDNTFDGDGYAMHANAATVAPSRVERGTAGALQADGKIVAVGYGDNSTDYDLVVWRYNTNGSLDNTFDGDGFANFHNATGGNNVDEGYGVAIQTDGKIVVVGRIMTAAGNYDLAVWRLNTNGSLDNTFDGDGFRSHNSAAGGNGHDIGTGVVIQSDSKIVVVGASRNGGGNDDLVVWRFNPDGSLDNTFDGDGYAVHNGAAGGNSTDYGRGIALQTDGRILVVGNSHNGANDDLAVWRFNADGSLDNTFDGDGYVVHNSAAGGNGGDYGLGVAVQADSRIIIAGYSRNAGGNEDLAVWRYNPAGTLDATFDGDGYAVHNSAAGGNSHDYGCGVAVQTDGRFVVVGYSFNGAGDEDLALWRFLANNAPVTPWNPEQRYGVGGTLVATNGTLVSRAILSATASDSEATDTFCLEFEVRPAGAAFTSPATVTADNATFFRSAASASGATETLAVTITTLAEGTYRWQVRSRDTRGDTSVWRAGDTFVFVLQETTLPVAQVIAASDSSPTVTPPQSTTESFVQVNLRGGDTTAGALVTASDSVGTGADYSCTFALINGRDTALMPIWTNQSSLRVFIGLRSDTGTLAATGLPSGITDNDTGRRAFGATALLLEFADSTGRLLGDSKTTTYVGDSFAYTLRYYLSETTVALYRSLGFDTAAGSNSFRFWYADTYGGLWIQDTTCTVVVSAAAAPWNLCISVSGLTKDLPGGLGGVASGSASASGSNGSACILTMAANYGLIPASTLETLRTFRDLIMVSKIGRLFTLIYYLLG